MRTIRITTMLRHGVRDNQGLCITNVVHTLSPEFAIVQDVKVGKIFEIDLDDTVTDEQVTKIAEAVTNTVIERYTVEFLD